MKVAVGPSAGRPTEGSFVLRLLQLLDRVHDRRRPTSPRTAARPRHLRQAAGGGRPPLGAAAQHEPISARIRDLAQGAGIRLNVPADTPPADTSPRPLGLTARELEVLRLLMRGSTNAQIGKGLYMSPKTASVHITSIMRNSVRPTGHRLPGSHDRPASRPAISLSEARFLDAPRSSTDSPVRTNPEPSRLRGLVDSHTMRTWQTESSVVALPRLWQGLGFSCLPSRPRETGTGRLCLSISGPESSDLWRWNTPSTVQPND